MRLLCKRTLIAIAAISAGVSSLSAQQPTQTPVPQLPQGAMPVPGNVRPEVVQQLRQQLAASGMTQAQIHARLRAAGYPENLLDAYLPSGTTAPNPSPETFRAVQELGIADSSDVALLRLLQSDSTSQATRDSIMRLKGTVPYDSLMRERDKYRVRADIADSLARLDSGYNIFGLEAFRSPTSQFEPNVGGPVDANYRLGPGDRLVLILTGDVEASYPLDVTREGFVVIPQVGQLYVANLTLGDLEDLLYTRLGRVYSGVRRGPRATTRFSVSVARLRSNQVFVLGDVLRPGSYMISSAGTALTALYAAGGPTAAGSLRSIEIRRDDKPISNFDLYDYLLRGDASRDVRLQTGDIVFVPSRGPRVRIVGEVIRPGTYEMKSGETLETLISAAGGYRADAARSRIRIERVLPPSQRAEGRARITMDVAPDASSDGATPAVRLEGGDVVTVFRVPARIRNTVVVEGNVWTPGRQGLEPGMKIADAIRKAGGPKPDVYLGQVLVDRLRPDSTRVQLRAALRDSLGNVVNDFPLQEDDIIHVFALTDFRATRYVAIGGAVQKAGRYAYRDGMSMRDLVLLAGGLKEGAYLKEAEIARLPSDRGGLTTAVTIRVPLDSTYLFDRKPGEPYLGPPGMPASPNGAPEVPLKPYDNVLIMQQPNWEMQRVVTISGEVRFPGQYALKSRNEKLADLIDRAGGLTTEAYPEGTVFTRSDRGVGRVAIDVPRALKDRRSPENMLLMDGDAINVPVRSNVVAVRGAVNAPNVVAYVEGRDLDYYISQAGGPTQSADNGHAFVTQPSGKRETRNIWGPRQPKPMPGSIVEVPLRDPANQTNYLAALGNLAQVLASLVTMLVAIKRF